MNKVWVVTDGCYSDYHIVGIFSTEELAKQYVNKCLDAKKQCETLTGELDRYSYADISIEEYDLDTLNERSPYFQVEISVATGSAERYYSRIGTTNVKWCDPYNYGLNIVANGQTIEHAIKNAQDFRRVFLTRPTKGWTVDYWSHDSQMQQGGVRPQKTFNNTLEAFTFAQKQHHAILIEQS